MRIKRLVVMAIVAGFMGISTAGTARAFEASGEATVDVLTTYVWRGINLGENEMVVQPAVGITYDNYTFNMWANYDSEMTEHNETDYTLSYSRSMDKLSLEAGYIYYAIDGAENDSQEVYLSLGYDTVLSPSLTFFYDFDLGEGWFLIASLEHSFELSGNMSLNLGASASVNGDNEVMGQDEDGDDFTDFYNGELTASVSIPVTANITIEPKIAYTFPLSNDAGDAIESLSLNGDRETLYGGIGASLSF